MKNIALQGSALQRSYLKLMKLTQALLKNFELPILIILFLLPKEAFEKEELLRWVGQFVASLFILVGFFLRFSSRGYEKDGAFVLDGPYRFVQNPDELGSVLLYMGLFGVIGVAWSWQLTIFLILMFYFAWISNAYQDALKLRAGVRYEKYSQRVRRWIPSYFPGVNRSGIPFNYKRSFREDKMLWGWILGVGVVLFLRYRFRDG